MQVYVVVWQYMEHWVTAITICTRHTRVALSRVGTLKEVAFVQWKIVEGNSMKISVR